MAENTVDRLKITGGFLIFLTIAAVYSPFWNSSLTYYQDNILMNLLSQWNEGKLSLIEILGGKVATGNGFGPLTILTYLADVSIYGLEPGLFHITNILLHTVTCVLLFILLTHLSVHIEAAFWAALMFSLHPLHTGTIGLLQARGELLAGFLAVPAVYFFVEYYRKKQLLQLSIAAVFLFFAILANERLILMPVFLFVYTISRTKIKENLLQLLVTAVILSGPIISYSIFRIILKDTAATSGVVGMNLFYNAHIVPETLALFFLPYKIPVLMQFNATLLLAGLAILGGLLGTGVYVYKKNKVVTFFTGTSWFICFMIPGIFTWLKFGDVDVYTLSASYIALIGLVLPLATLLEMLQAKLQKYFPLVTIIVVILFFGLTVINGGRFLSGEKFWRAVTNENPDNLEVYRGRFVFLLEQNKFTEAEQLAKSVLKEFDVANIELRWFVQSFESKGLYKAAEGLLLKYKREIISEELYHDLIRNLILCGDLDMLPQYVKNKKFAKDKLLAHLNGFIGLFRSRAKLEYSQKMIIGKAVIERMP
ncbi:MAG: hypothetical protein HYV28_10175 [Ignavibacteriales bacterium]|nr:hypothetical protein [Ignavibacteriales bacterium]